MITETLPPVVSAAEWRAARERLLRKEKEGTRALDALAAERRRLPMVRIENEYRFQGPGGTTDLAGLFEGRRQLIVYHFMLAAGDDHVCAGCSGFTDNIGRPEHLNARDTTLALVSPAAPEEIRAVQRRMGWTVPWYSSLGTGFNRDLGVFSDGCPPFGISVFIRSGGEVFRSYFTGNRGIDRLRLDFNLLDLTPFGRQEEWEESPPGWPQTPPYAWWRHHDEYAPEEGR